MNNKPEKLLLDYDGAAESLAMTRNALRDLVYKRRGPVIVKIGARTFFSPKDLEIWIGQHRVASSL